MTTDIRTEGKRLMNNLLLEAQATEHLVQQARWRNDKKSEQWLMGLQHGLRQAADQFRPLFTSNANWTSQ